jgi:hypothetical protein
MLTQEASMHPLQRTPPQGPATDFSLVNPLVPVNPFASVYLFETMNQIFAMNLSAAVNCLHQGLTISFRLEVMRMMCWILSAALDQGGTRSVPAKFGVFH